MSSEVPETTITRITSSDNLWNEESNGSEDDCDSDDDLDDNRYDVIPQELSSKVLDVLKDLYLNNGFNILEIIQTNSEDVTKVCHCLLLDDKHNDNTVDEITVSENDCIFWNKSKFIKQLQEKCRQKGAKNVKKSLNFRPNYSSVHKRVNKAIQNYRRVSNYGSEYFKKKDRFKDMKPFVNESKDNKHFGANQPNRGRGHPSQQREQFGHHRGGRGSPRGHNPYIRSRYESNLMTEGVVTQMSRAFGNRKSYVHQNDRQNDYNYFESNNSNLYEKNGSRDGKDIQYYGQINQFVTNPMNNQNYNSFQEFC